MKLDPELWRAHRQANRFTVVCSIYLRGAGGSRERIVVRNLPYEAAESLAERLQARYDLRHPGRSSWTKRHYWARLGQPVPGKPARSLWSQL